MAKPCVRCLQNPKIPGTGQRYCLECKADLSADPVDRQRERYRQRGDAWRRKIGKPRQVNRDAPPGTKWCPECQKYLALRNFKRSGKASYCKDCQAHVYYRSYVKRTYGITIEQYYAILDHQGGGCAICNRKLKTKKYAVDHNHKTGEVRGLLCGPCNNRILGSARDSPEILRRAADYLEEPPARAILGKLSDRSDS